MDLLLPVTMPLLHRLRSLRAAIVLAVLAGVVLAAVISYAVQSASLREQHTEQTHVELERLATLTSLALREPLWQFDVEQANSLLEAAFVNPALVSIRVWDHKGVPFASRERSASDATLVLQDTREVMRSELLVGKLTIEMSTAGYLQKLADVRRQLFWNAAQAAVIALLVILAVLHWRLMQPLGQLVQASQRIKHQELATPIKRTFDDEVGVLADSLEATRLALLDLIAQLENRNRALTQANEHLEQRVDERTESLAKALHTLEQAQKEIVQTEKVASLGRVVAGVAHELNTPIGNALTVVSTLQSDLERLQVEVAAGGVRKSTLGNYLERADEGMGLALANLARAAHLISDFKQVTVDHTSDQRRVFDLADVTNELLNMLQPRLRRSGLQVQRFLQPGVSCDSYPGRYGQVLTNLVMNVLIHAFENRSTGTLSIYAGPLGDDQLELRVVDDGAGMTDDVRHRVFDPFFTTKMGRGGTGLGMHIVHTIVTQVLTGQISVASAPGQGTTVRVCIPRVVPEAAQHHDASV
jgi:two-component system, NtrC family, sensor kinase